MFFSFCRRRFSSLVPSDVARKKSAVYSWGTGVLLGFGEKEDRHRPTLVSELKRHRVVSLSASFSYTFAVTDRHQIFSWGRFSAGIQQPNRRSEFIRLPTLCDNLEGREIVQVHAGRSHALALARSGILLSWGGSELGQRGHGVEGDGEELLIPAPIDALTGRVAQLAVGLDHNLALTHDNELFVWGYGEEGQLGVGDEMRLVTRPQQLQSERLKGRRIESVHCGSDSSALLTDTGEAFVFGNNHHGQLGLGDTRERTQPVLLKYFLGRRLRGLALGTAHTVFLTDDGRVFTSGWGEDGRLGTGNTQSVAEPVLLPPSQFGDEPIERVFAGGGSSFALTRSGRLFAWGFANAGRLGLEPESTGDSAPQNDSQAVLSPLPMPFFEPSHRRELLLLTVGIDHAVAVVRRKEIERTSHDDDDDEEKEL